MPPKPMIRLRLTAAIARMTMRVNSVIMKVLPVTRRIDRQQREDHEQAGDERIARSEPGGHLLDAGNRPSGRNTRIAAISV